MIFTNYYTRVAALDEKGYTTERLGELIEMAKKIKHSRIHEPRPWTQRKISDLKQGLRNLAHYVQRMGSPHASSLANALDDARNIFSDMPWREPEIDKWYEWEKTIDQKVDDFIRRVELLNPA